MRMNLVRLSSCNDVGGNLYISFKYVLITDSVPEDFHIPPEYKEP